MILFNDVALEAIAPVKVEDVRLSPIPLNVTARQRPILWGSDFVRVTGGNRSVSITFGVLEENTDARQTYIEAICKWAGNAIGRLEIPGHDGVYLECLCTQRPEPSTRQWWESKLRLVFTTYNNPFFTAKEEKTAQCGTAFYVDGTAPPLMRITNTYSAAATNQSWSDGTDTISFSSIGAGDFVLDLNRQTAAVDGTSAMGSYNYLTSRFLIPKTGQQTITGTGTIHYTERWG